MLCLSGILFIFHAWSLYLLISFYTQRVRLSFMFSLWPLSSDLNLSSYDDEYLVSMVWLSCVPTLLVTWSFIRHSFDLRRLTILSHNARLHRILRAATARLKYSGNVDLCVPGERKSQLLPYARQGFRKNLIVIPDQEALADAADDVVLGIFAHELSHLRYRDAFAYGLFSRLLPPYAIWAVAFVVATLVRPELVSAYFCIPPIIASVVFIVGYSRIHIVRERLADEIASREVRHELLSAIWWAESRSALSHRSESWAGFLGRRKERENWFSRLRRVFWAPHPSYEERRRCVASANSVIIDTGGKYWISWFLSLGLLFVYLTTVVSGDGVILFGGSILVAVLGKHLYCLDYLATASKSDEAGGRRLLAKYMGVILLPLFVTPLAVLLVTTDLLADGTTINPDAFRIEHLPFVVLAIVLSFGVIGLGFEFELKRAEAIRKTATGRRILTIILVTLPLSALAIFPAPVRLTWIESEIDLPGLDPGIEVSGGNLCWSASDGSLRTVAYRGEEQIGIVSLDVDTEEWFDLESTYGPTIWSIRCAPNNDDVLFRRRSGEIAALYRVRNVDHVVEQISLSGENVADMAWSSDGQRLVYITYDGDQFTIVHCRLNMGAVEREVLASFDATSVVMPVWSPDDRLVTVGVRRETEWHLAFIQVPSARVEVLAIDGRLISSGWVANEEKMYIATASDVRNAVWMVYDGSTTDRGMLLTSESAYAVVDPQTNRFISYRGFLGDRHLVLIQPGARDSYVTTSRRLPQSISWSADGRGVAFVEVGPSGYLIKALRQPD